MPVLKCHCVEVRATCGLHRTGWEKHQCTKAYSDKEDARKAMSFSVMRIKATECSFLIFGQQSQKQMLHYVNFCHWHLAPWQD